MSERKVLNVSDVNYVSCCECGGHGSDLSEWLCPCQKLGLLAGCDSV